MSIRDHALAVCLAVCATGCSPSPNPRVAVIDIVAFGELRYGRSTSSTDPTSPIGAQLAVSEGMHVSRQTDRIPLRLGASYGLAFIVRGSPPDAVVDIKVVLRSSAGCALKATGKVVYENESTLPVRIGQLRHIGGRIVAPQEDHCVGPPAPGTDTFELWYRGKKLAEKRFDLVNDSGAEKLDASKRK